MGETRGEVLDVVIVGAGFTGLAAARELDRVGARFCVVEAFPDHLGGRAYSYDPEEPPGTELRFDHGAEYIGDLQSSIMKEIRELLPPGSLVNGAHLRLPFPWEVMVLDQKRHVFRADSALFGIPGVPPDLGIEAALGMIGVLAEMTLIEWSIDVLEPWSSHPSLLALDTTDIWTWLGQKHWVVPSVKDLLRISVEALLSVEPHQISPLYLLWYTACNDGFQNEINDGAGGPQQYWLRGGTSGLAAEFAKPIQDHIRRGVRVSKIDHTDDVVTITTDDGGELRAKKVLIATSPKTATRIELVPDLPPDRRELFSQPMGITVKCQVFYRTRWWHDSNGKAFDGYVGGANYPILWVMDNTPADPGPDGPFVLMTFTVGDQAETLLEDPSHDRIVAWVTSTLSTLFGDERALSTSPELVKLVAHVWAPSDPYVGGGPNTVMQPGVLTGAAGRLLNEPWDDKVFFASAENAKNLEPLSDQTSFDLFAKDNTPEYEDAVLKPTSKPPFTTKYSDMRRSLGYMDGALVSGRYAAHQIAKSLGLAYHPGLDAARRSVVPTPPPAPAPLGAEALRGVAEALVSELSKVSADEIREWGDQVRRTGRGGVSSWLRDTLIRIVGEQGHASPHDSAAALARVRDFAVGAIEHRLGLVKAPPGGADDEHTGPLKDALAKAHDLIVKL